MIKRLLVALVVCIGLLSYLNVHASVKYVTQAGASTKTGASWGTALDSVKFRIALRTANYGDTFWVAAGTYTPADKRDSTFYVPSGVRVFGGFSGVETRLSQRNWRLHVTTLSGDIGVKGKNTDNCYNVVRFNHVDSTTTLDGFTIAHGNANKALSADGNHTCNGGGIFNMGSKKGSSNPIIANCIFTADSAYYFGGGIYNDGDSGGRCNPVITNCSFIKNYGQYGGGVFNESVVKGTCNPLFTNCLYYNNKAVYAGAVFNYSTAGICKPVFINATFANNMAQNGGAFYSNTAMPKLLNCILWKDTATSSGNEIYDYASADTLVYTDIRGGWAGPGHNIINQDPKFINIAVDSLQLRKTSPCIAGGITTGLPVTDSLDLAGNKRTQKGYVDMGAYESPYNSCLTVNLIDTTIFSYQSYTFNSVTYTRSGRYTNILVNKAGCDSLIVLTLTVQPCRKYVTTGGAGLKNGSSWGNAFDSVSFRTALPSALYGDTFWMAAGTYTPANNRDSTFYIPSGVKVYGGFAGTETKISQRNYATNITILSGDIGAPVKNKDNCYNVVRFNSADSTTILDGFTVAHGNANGSISNYQAGGAIYNRGGGGVNSNPRIMHCIFTNDSALYNGGGIFNYSNGSAASPTIIQCTFSNTYAHYNGGAIYNYGYGGNSSPVILNCTFDNNISVNTGGAIYNNSNNHGNCSPLIANCVFSNNNAAYAGAINNDASAFGNCKAAMVNCLFYANTSTYSGGAIYNTGSIGNPCLPTITNCTFSKNFTQQYGGAIYNSFANTLLVNSILWKDSAKKGSNELYDVITDDTMIVNNSDIQGGWTKFGSNNINADPLFINSAADTFQLQKTSPCLATGSTTALAASDTTDLAGRKRTNNSNVDMGAYESPYNNCLTTLKIDTTLKSGQYYTIGTKHYSRAGLYFTSLLNKAGCDSVVTLNLKIVPSHRYVLPAGAGTKAGFSWGNAIDSVIYRQAVNSAIYGDTFWVAAGTYTPGNAHDSSFKIPSGVKVYGGFAGTETILSQRNYVTNVTALSGKIHGANGSNKDYILNIVRFNHADSTTVLDGFTITHGYAFGSSALNNRGGAIYNDGSVSGSSNPLIAHCTFIYDSAYYLGGAIFNNGSNGGKASPIITHCTFTSNYSDNDGGAVYNYGISGISSPAITYCTFIKNKAKQYGGAVYDYGYGYPSVSSPYISNCTFSYNISGTQGDALYNNGNGGNSQPTVINCLFNGNSGAYSAGGAVFNDGSYSGLCIAKFINCTFYNNKATGGSYSYGGAIYNIGGSGGLVKVYLYNCILWKDTASKAGNEIYNYDTNCKDTLYNCDFRGGWTGGGSHNVNLDPLFVNPTADSLQLKATSRCVNGGSNAYLPAGDSIDLGGKARVQKRVVDMGAYEGPYTASWCTSSSASTSVTLCNRLSYTFNGHTYSVPGTYNDTITNKAGCDSAVATKVTINATHNTINAALCPGKSFTFHTKTFTTAGTYLDTLVNKHSCDSFVTIVLTSQAGSTSAISTSICSGSSYTFNGKSLTSAGTYLDTIKNAHGCDSLITLTLAVKNKSTSSTSATICYGQSYTFNGSTYTASGTYTAHLTNKTGCDSAATLNLTIRSAATIHNVNDTIKAGDSITINHKVYKTAGSFSDTLYSKLSGCDSVIMHISITTATGVNELRTMNEELRIYPNPFNSYIHIDIPNNTAEAIITVNDILGQQVLTKTVKNATSAQLDLSALNAGVYTIQVKTANGQWTCKVVKQN